MAEIKSIRGFEAAPAAGGPPAGPAEVSPDELNLFMAGRGLARPMEG